MKNLILFTLFLALIITPGCNDQKNNRAGTLPAKATEIVSKTVTYKVIFTNTWSKKMHPTDFPKNPHFSGLIGATHNKSISFWQIGELASPGIKKMAETGSKCPLGSEIKKAIKAGKAQYKLCGPWMPRLPGKVEKTFKISQDFPLVTLVTMIAPSPDWFVGVSSLPLFEDGKWVEKKVINLYAYDAGTDSGKSYSSPNKVTKPREKISKLGGKSFGTFSFLRLK